MTKQYLEILRPLTQAEAATQYSCASADEMHVGEWYCCRLKP